MNNKPIRENYSHAIADAAKKKKHNEAEIRAEVRAKRSIGDQLALIKDHRGESKKEKARLNTKLLQKRESKYDSLANTK